MSIEKYTITESNEVKYNRTPKHENHKPKECILCDNSEYIAMQCTQSLLNKSKGRIPSFGVDWANPSIF